MSAEPMQLAIPVTEDDHQAGPGGAPVTLVEYGDYQCPYCGAAHPMIKKLQDAMGDDLRFIFRNFPLTQIHEYAGVAAEAAEAAGAQGAFWPYHDILFEHQDALTIDDLLGYGHDLDLDVTQMGKDLESSAFVERVRGDFMGGVRSDVNGTPTFFINGHRYDGAYEFEALLNALRSAAG